MKRRAGHIQRMNTLKRQKGDHGAGCGGQLVGHVPRKGAALVRGGRNRRDEPVVGMAGAVGVARGRAGPGREIDQIGGAGGR